MHQAIARFPGKCSVCKEPFVVGNPIVKPDTGKWCHPNCGVTARPNFFWGSSAKKPAFPTFLVLDDRREEYSISSKREWDELQQQVRGVTDYRLAGRSFGVPVFRSDASGERLQDWLTVPAKANRVMWQRAGNNPAGYPVPAWWGEPKPPYANWTSYPTYSYEQFYRTNPRRRSGKEQLLHDLDNDRSRGAITFDEFNQLYYAIHKAGMRKEAERILVDHRRARANSYTPMPRNAGPYLPDMFPYGQGGRPFDYYGEEEARENPTTHTDERSIRKSADRVLRDYPEFCKQQIARWTRAKATAEREGYGLTNAMELLDDWTQRLAIAQDELVKRDEKRDENPKRRKR